MPPNSGASAGGAAESIQDTLEMSLCAPHLFPTNEGPELTQRLLLLALRASI